MSATTTTTATKTVLVTGATRGIGLKLAERYIQNGWNVIAAARNLDKAEQLKALSPYKIVQLDTSDETSILRAAKQLEGEPIDLLINNAGIAIPGRVEEATKADLLLQFEVNAVGPFLVTRALTPNLKAAVAARGTATVAQISSIIGSIAFISNGSEEATGNNHTGYLTSKAALNMINASLALELKRDGIAAVVVHPGLVATEMNGYVPQGITPDASVDGITATIAKLSIADAGKFYSYDGEIIAW